MTSTLAATLKRLIWFCVLPLLLLSAGLGWDSLQEQEAKHLREASNLASNFALSIDQDLESRLKALNMLAVSPLVDDQRRWPELYAEAQGFKDSFAAHVIFADHDRQMLFNTVKPYGSELPRLPDSKGRTAAPLALATGKPQVGDIVIGPVNRQPLVALAMPVLREGRPPRLMLSILEAARFKERVERFALPDGWSIVLRDGTGADIARKSPPAFDSNRDVAEDHRFTARLENAPWSVVVEIPRAIHSATHLRAALLLAAAIFFATILGIVGGTVASRGIGRQLMALTDPAGHSSEPITITEIAAARDKLAEARAAREASEARFHQLFDLAPLPIGYLAKDGRILAHNRRFESVFGYQLADLANIDDWWQLACPDDAYRARVTESWEKAVARAVQSGGDVEPSVYRIQCKNGSTRDMQVSGIVLTDGLLATFYDVTEQKQAEQAMTRMLEEHKAGRLAALNLMDDARAAQAATEAALREVRKLSMAIEQSPESIVITDSGARIEYVNEAFVRSTGYSRAEVLGQNPNILQSGKTLPDHYASLWTTLEKGEAWKGEFYNRRKDGSEYIEFAVVAPIRQPDGEVTHYVGVKEDVTEKKRMAEELDGYRQHLEQLVTERTEALEQSRELAEAANRAKSAFLANMSHEIRTPMNAILGFTHLMRRDARSSQETDRLGKIDSAAKHLLPVINDILDLSKIEAGKVELEIHDFSLDAVLDHVAVLIGDSAASKGLAVHVVSDPVPCWLSGDLTRLRQGLLNLAANAVKFTERGSVTLRARLVASEEARCLIRFEVEDTGIGIPPEVMPQLFEAFQQADVTTTRKFGGTGLGLAITRRLASLMGGEAGAESSPGAGSIFWFTAWLARGMVARLAPEAVDGNAPRAQRHRVGARILVVEDDAINREVATELLQEAGMTAETAETGRQALERLASRNYDLILMDMRMPEMDGIEATRAIRSMPSAGHIPILAMTANAFDDDRQACMAAGMNDFVSKPVDPPKLFAALDKWLPDAGQVSAAQAGRAEQDREPGLSSPNPPYANDLVAQLAREPCVDVEQGLSVLRGNQLKWIKLLRSMVVAHRNDMRDLEFCLSSGNRDQAMRIVHTLKGVAATLGATALSSAARAVEERLRATGGALPDDLGNLKGEVTTQLERLLEILGDSAPV